MFNDDTHKNHPSICNFVAGYAYYENAGNGLAEGFLNLVEGLLSLLANIRK